MADGAGEQRPLVSVVIPVYRGERSIGTLSDRLVEAFGNSPYDLELVLVNDCSPDDSHAVCVEIQKHHPRQVRYLRLARNVGEHNAVMAGLNHCRGAWAVIMDDDFQNPVEEALRLVGEARRTGHDVVYTWYEQKHHAWWRNLGSRFNGMVATVMLRKPRDLYLSSFKVINRFLIDQVIRYDLPYPYLDGLILRTTSSIGTLKVAHEPRREGQSSYTLTKLVRLWLNMFTNFSILPLRVSMVLGMVIAFCGLILGGYALWEKWANPHLPMGYASLMVVFLVFSGVQLVSLGLIGEYLGRVFLSQNRKPQFTVREVYEAVPEREKEA